jgi:hypothetical protein
VRLNAAGEGLHYLSRKGGSVNVAVERAHVSNEVITDFLLYWSSAPPWHPFGLDAT